MQCLKQISVFIENKAGGLAEVTAALTAANIDIRTLTLADTQDFGLLRLITDDPDGAVKAILDAGFPVKTTEVLCVHMEDKAGSLHTMLSVLNAAGMDIRYCYAFVSRRVNGAFVVFRVDSNEAAGQALLAKGYELYGQEELASL